ncbi:MAG: hypothetical protein Q8K62_09780 [Thiobacillus sp.]|nr:hypothetical protein [Thiobacillus sp.]
MSKVTNKLASGIRKVKEQQASPAAAVKQPAPRVDQGKAEPVAIPKRTDTGSFLNPCRVWPD